MGLVIFIFYTIMTVLTYVAISMLISVNIGIDDEFDEAMQDGSSKMFAVLIVSIL